MQEVSDKIIVLLVIVAVIVSVIGTFVVTTAAFNVAQGQNSPIIQREIQQPDNTAGVVAITVVDKDTGDDSSGG